MIKIQKNKKKEQVKEVEEIIQYEDRTIYVMYMTEEHGTVASVFENIVEAAEFIDVKPHVVKSVLTESSLYGNKWTSNIFTKKIDDDSCYRYIIVYKDIWDTYSTKKRTNRLRKISQ